MFILDKCIKSLGAFARTLSEADYNEMFESEAEKLRAAQAEIEHLRALVARMEAGGGRKGKGQGDF
jgi:hypothetical protein